MNGFFRFSHKVYSQVSARAALLLTTLILSLSVLSGTTHADGLYQVELVVFSRDGSDNEERWRNGANLRYPEHLQQLVSASENANEPFQLLPVTALQLKREATAIGQRRNMRVLFHGAWQQMLGSAEQAPSIFISGGQPYGQHHELEGFITLAADKFLHLDTQLWMTRFAQEPGTNTADLPVLPPAPFAAADAPAIASNTVPTQLYVLREQRRLRSGELLYQDHPRLGTLVLITPLNNTPQP